MVDGYFFSIRFIELPPGKTCLTILSPCTIYLWTSMEMDGSVGKSTAYLPVCSRRPGDKCSRYRLTFLFVFLRGLSREGGRKEGWFPFCITFRPTNDVVFSPYFIKLPSTTMPRPSSSLLLLFFNETTPACEGTSLRDTPTPEDQRLYALLRGGDGARCCHISVRVCGDQSVQEFLFRRSHSTP